MKIKSSVSPAIQYPLPHLKRNPEFKYASIPQKEFWLAPIAVMSFLNVFKLYLAITSLIFSLVINVNTIFIIEVCVNFRANFRKL